VGKNLSPADKRHPAPVLHLLPVAFPSASPTPTPLDPKKAGVWRSDDKGKTWRIVSNENNRPMYYSQIRVSPRNPEIVFVGGLNFSRSTDGGKTFKSLQPGIAHSDHHAIWVDPNNDNHLMIGNDGGLDVSYDQGDTWEFVNTIAAAQFYAVAADMRKPYYVYGGLQDNGSWGAPSQTRSQAGITNADWFRIGGGDGFYAQADPSDHNIIYSESQNGAMNRLDLRTGRSVSIRPRATARPRGLEAVAREQQLEAPQRECFAFAQPTAEENPLAALAAAQGFGFGGFGAATANIVPVPPVGEQYRFYWNTPLVLSSHNPRILYVGTERLFRSLDRGDTWTAVSTDLTKHMDRTTMSIMGISGKDPMASKNDGYTNFGHIVTVAESPKMPGVLWVGTDDGNVQISRDGGTTWTNVARMCRALARCITSLV